MVSNLIDGPEDHQSCLLPAEAFPAVVAALTEVYQVQYLDKFSRDGCTEMAVALSISVSLPSPVFCHVD